MKIALPVLVFLFSISLLARQNRYDDGSYYNDDYIHDEDTINNTSVPEPTDTYNPAEMPPEPVQKKVAPLKKKRKPASMFHEVNTSGKVKGFTNITNDRLDSDYYESDSSRGSR